MEMRVSVRALKERMRVREQETVQSNGWSGGSAPGTGSKRKNIHHFLFKLNFLFSGHWFRRRLRCRRLADRLSICHGPLQAGHCLPPSISEIPLQVFSFLMFAIVNSALITTSVSWAPKNRNFYKMIWGVKEEGHLPLPSDRLPFFCPFSSFFHHLQA